MSRAPSATATGRKGNRFDPEDFASVLAPKGGAAGAVTGAEPRSLPEVRPAPTATDAAEASTGPAPATGAVARQRYSTSLDFPDYVDEQITGWLREHPEHVFKTMILHALTKIGLEIRPEDLVPQRRRRR